MNNLPAIQTALMVPDKDTVSCILNLTYTLNLNMNFESSVRISLVGNRLDAYMEQQHPTAKFMYDVLYKKSQTYDNLEEAISTTTDDIERYLLINLSQLRINLNNDNYNTNNVHVWFHSGIATLFYKRGIESISWRILFARHYDREHYVPVFVNAPIRYQLDILNSLFNVKGWNPSSIARQLGCSVEYLTNLITEYYRTDVNGIEEKNKAIDI